MKQMFTPGPASIHKDSIHNISNCFGRGDDEYLATESEVIDLIKGLCHQEHVVALQGSATLAIEIAAKNFLYGKVLVVDTGYYSRRLHYIAQHCSEIQQLGTCSVDEITPDSYDWIVCCPVETGLGHYTPINFFKDAGGNSKLFVDATGSIGLETGHELADVMAFSGCKGLFGLTGAAFIAYSNANPHGHNSYYMDLATHINRGVTGPYHAIQSLLPVLRKHEELFESVKINKKAALSKFKEHLVFSAAEQPYLCTALTKKVQPNPNNDVVLYQPRDMGDAQSVICHLGELHLGKDAQANILGSLI